MRNVTPTIISRANVGDAHVVIWQDSNGQVWRASFARSWGRKSDAGLMAASWEYPVCRSNVPHGKPAGRTYDIDAVVNAARETLAESIANGKEV